MYLIKIQLQNSSSTWLELLEPCSKSVEIILEIYTRDILSVLLDHFVSVAVKYFTLKCYEHKNKNINCINVQWHFEDF